MTKPKAKPALDPTRLDLDLVRGELSRRSLKTFVKTFWHCVEPGSQFIDGWVVDALCDHFANLDQIGNLLVNICPRVGKSNLVAVFFPAWRWLHCPGEKFLYSSYTIGNAERDSLKCRRLIQSDLYQKCFGSTYQLSDDQNTKRRYANNKNGERLVTSLDGSTTGEGGSLCVHDDPHAADEADSEIKRNTAIRWFTDTWLSRLNPGGTGRIVIGQRIHKNDVSGYILDNYKSEWNHLCLPYEYNPRTTVAATKLGWVDPRTEEGEPLWPARFQDSEIAQLKRKPRSWSCQYNQNPIDYGNTLFSPDNLVYYDEDDSAYYLEGRKVLKSETWRLMSADLATSTDIRADYTAVVVADITKNCDIIVKHILRERIPGMKIVNELVKVNDVFNPAYVIMEDGGFQKIILQQARQAGMAIRGVKHQGLDKEARSIPLQGRWEQKQVWLPKEGQWVGKFIDEIMTFPNGGHDDQVDSLSYLVQEANKKTKHRPEAKIEPPPQKSWQQVYNDALTQGLW